MTPVIQREVARALYHRTSGWSRKRLRQELEDMVQWTFEDLFARDAKALRAWDPARGRSFLSFVALVARHRVASVMETKYMWRATPADDDDLAALIDEAPDPGPEVLYANQQLLVGILEALPARVTPRGLEMFERLFVDESSSEDVAREMALAVTAVDKWRSRLRKLVKIIAAELLSDGGGKR